VRPLPLELTPRPGKGRPKRHPSSHDSTRRGRRNRFQAESILAQLEDLIPGRSVPNTLRNKVAALPWPNENLVIALDGGVKMEFVLIRPGSFMMGSDKKPFPR